MIVKSLPKFDKQFKKLSPKLQDQFQQRLALLLEDPSARSLRIHQLKGSYVGYWSMNVNGDLRALYKKQGDAIIIFALIDTHSQLYGK